VQGNVLHRAKIDDSRKQRNRLSANVKPGWDHRLAIVNRGSLAVAVTYDLRLENPLLREAVVGGVVTGLNLL